MLIFMHYPPIPIQSLIVLEQHQAELSRALTQAQHTLTQCNLDMKEKQKEVSNQCHIVHNCISSFQSSSHDYCAIIHIVLIGSVLLSIMLL